MELLHLKQEHDGGGDDALAFGRVFRRRRRQGADEDCPAEFEYGQKIVIEHYEKLQTGFFLKGSPDALDEPESNSYRF